MLCVVMLTSTVWGQRKGLTSKVYVSSISGEAVINTGEKIQDLVKRSVHVVEGTIIETGRAVKANDRPYSTMVYSNGPGAFFDADTRVEVKKFSPKSFSPNRTDLDVEPSVSQFHGFIARGAVGLCTSKLVAGSAMSYQTPTGTVNIRGRKIVIETNEHGTKISMLEGESSVRAGNMDTGGHIVRAGEQAIIHRGQPGEPNQIQITRIPPAEAPGLEDRVAMACMAKRTVYFEQQDRAPTLQEKKAMGAKGAGSVVAPEDVSAFDDGGQNDRRIHELIPREVVPLKLPTEFTISPARIYSASCPGG